MATVTLTFKDTGPNGVDLDIDGEMYVEDLTSFALGRQPTPAQQAALAAVRGASLAARKVEVTVEEEVAK